MGSKKKKQPPTKKLSNKTTFIVLSLITLFGFLIRIFNVGSLPAILNRDEAALAYNGMMISEIGRDEFGKQLPLTLESFGDYKLPGYPYTLALLFKVFPVNDWTVRLPSVLAGTLLIVISFFLAKNFNFKDKFALFFSFLISLTPIFIFYSRIAFEANVALTLFVGAIALLTLKKTCLKTEFGAVILTILAILFYNTPLLLLPFVTIALIISRGINQPKTWLPISSIFFVIFVATFLSLSSISAQKSGITIFSDESTWVKSVDYYNSFSGISQKILGNKYVFYATQIVPNFWESFSMHFLVTGGGTHPWHNIPGHAHLYFTTFLISLLGLLVLIKKSIIEKKHLFILVTLLCSLIPSVITVDSPHATRSLLFIYLLLFTSLYFISIIRRKYIKKALIVLSLLVIAESASYLYKYFVNYPNMQPQSLGVGYDKVIIDVEEKYPDKNVAIVDGSGYQYILTAWYLKIDPQLFLDTVIKQLPDKIGFKYGEQLTHYHFIAQPTDRDESETVLVELRDNQWQVTNF